MRIKGVDFPAALLDAQRAGKLVVFAGAGVSMPPPSNYPNFEGLSSEVAAGASTREDGESDDRFLGRLERQEVLVHEVVCQLLTSPDSRPNALHNAILGLFPGASRVRLATTNFDDHFSAASRTVFTEPIEAYYAPALPLGHDFSGIVYLHGSAGKEPRRLVLTDSDFGRAYVTEGWATRFLSAMFLEYTVLFVGYSHRDPVVDYLARGLPSRQQGRRYALCPEKVKDIDYWRYLGVEPVVYPVRGAPDCHGALRVALAEWASDAQLGMLDWEQRIRRIVEAPPPVDPEAADFIARAMEDPTTCQFFTRHASRPEWLEWIEETHAFQLLFQPEQPTSDVTPYLADWFAAAYSLKHADLALAVVLRHGPNLHPLLWLRMVYLLSAPARPEPHVLATWLTILLHSTRPQHGDEDLTNVLLRCQSPEDRLTAIALFSDLATPQEQLRWRFALSRTSDQPERKAEVDVTLRGGFHS